MIKPYAKPNAFKRAFTLIELLVVMVIMAIILGIGAAAATSIMAGSAMRAGIVGLGSKFNVARAHARGYGKYVALVIPIKHTSLKNRAVIPIELEEPALDALKRGDAKLGSLIAGQSWFLLRNGLCLTVGKASGASLTDASADELTPISKENGPFFGFKNSDIDNEKLQYDKTPIADNEPCLVFNPKGQIVDPDDPESPGYCPIFFVLEGRVTPEGKVLARGASDPARPTTGNWRLLYINPFTGKVHFEMI